MMQRPTLSHEKLFQFWKSIESTSAFWRTFPTLVACPETASGASMMFPEATIITINSQEELLVYLQANRTGELALLSPWIFKDPSLFKLSMKASTRRDARVLGLYGPICNIPDFVETRKQIHAAGYYEVSNVLALDNASWDLEDSSVAYSPDGDFSYHSNHPGIVVDKLSPDILFASKLALNGLLSHRWISVFGLPRRSAAQSVRGSPGSNSFTFVKADVAPAHGSEQWLSGVFHWSEASSGHASICSCYSGPGDANMYAALLEPEGVGRANVSLWRHHKNWEKLNSHRVKAASNNGRNHLDLRILTTKDSVEVFSDGESIIRCEDQTVARSPTVGLRFSGESVEISNIKTGLSQ